MGIDCQGAKPAKLHHRRACPCGMMIESQKNAAPQPTPPKKDGLGSPFLAINHRSAGTSPAVAQTIQPAQPASLNSAERDPAGRRSCGRGGARSRRRLLPCACGNARSHKDAICRRSARTVKTGAQDRAGGAQRKKVPRSKRERGVKGKGKRQKVIGAKYQMRKIELEQPRREPEALKTA